MMTTILLLLLAAVLIWVFAESRTAGTVVAAIVGAIAIMALGYFIWRDVTEGPTRQAAPVVRERAPAPEQFKRSLTALQPSDIVLLNLKLANDVETYTGLDGVRRQRPDPDSWILTGAVRNLAAEQEVRDVGLQVRLYSCPSYFTTAIEEVKLEELASVCSRVGEASLGLYDLAVAPGQAVPFSTPAMFRNQGRADNWRFWVDVTRVVAQIETPDP